MRLLPSPFLIALAALGIVVSIDAVPGVFTVDDNNYLVNALALRRGRVTIPQTDGLPPSAELLFFDPGPWTRTVSSTPVASTAPPLYGPIALPFSLLGWRGLVALNTLAYLATTLLVFVYVRRNAQHEHAAWLAAGAFALGGFAIEYAEGVWPHMLSVALCTAGILSSASAADRGRVRDAAFAGLLLAVASGVRYQNVILLCAAGAGLVLWSSSRWKTAATFSAAAAIPLAASSLLNYARFGSLNPISKGPGYLTLSGVPTADGEWSDPLVMLWAKVVDFSARTPITGPGTEGWLVYEPATGAHLMLGDTLQKAFLQSAPWAIVGLLMFVLVWLKPLHFTSSQRRQILLLSLVGAALLGVMSITGPSRHEGFTFNQRYLLELLPLAAIGLGLSTDRMPWRGQPLAIGAIAGATAVLVILAGTPAIGTTDSRLWLFRHVLLFKVPLVLAAALGITWLLHRRSGGLPRLAALTLGLCLGWGMMLHYADDVRASHRTREYNRDRTARLAAVVQDGMTVVAYWYGKDAAVPLLFDRDVLILDAHADEGRDAPMLVRESLGRGRRVLLLAEGFPAPVLDRVTSGLQVRPLAVPGLNVYELGLEQ